MIDTDLTHFSGAHLTFQLKGTTETGEVINDDPQQFMNGLDQLKRRLDPQVKQWSKLVQKDIDFKSAPVVVI